MPSPKPPPPPAIPAIPPDKALLETNITRSWWILIITTIFTVLFTLSGKLTGTSGAFATVQLADYAGSTIFLILLWAARQGYLPERLRRAMAPTYAAYFILINDGYYFSAWPVAGDNVGYAFGVLTPAALLYLRPAFFVPFLLVNHAWVTVVILNQPVRFEETVSALYGTSISMLIAAISSVIHYRTKNAELEKTALVAERNQELAAANANLHAVSQRLDEMMAMTAHDLRGPLLSLASLCELEKDNPAWRDPVHAEFLDLVGNNANRMASVVNKTVADYAARNTSLEDLAIAADNLVPLFETAAREARPLALRKSIEIACLNFPAAAIAEINILALERIFNNLISNAIKYSPANTRIELGLVRDDRHWSCEVRDEGPGIPPEERSALFDKLQTGTNVPTSGEESTGLGLYSARKLAEAMGGTLEFEPRSPKGSVFRVSLIAVG